MRKLANTVLVCVVLLALSFGWKTACQMAHAIRSTVMHVSNP